MVKSASGFRKMVGGYRPEKTGSRPTVGSPSDRMGIPPEFKGGRGGGKKAGKGSGPKVGVMSTGKRMFTGKPVGKGSGRGCK